MPRFGAKALAAFNRTWKFVGGDEESFSEVETVTPITRVVDLQRTAEIASGLGGDLNLGFLSQGTTDAHVGAGVIETTFDPYALVAEFAAEEAATHMWVIDCYGSSSSGANFLQAITSLTYPNIPNVWSADDELVLFHAPDVLAVAVSAGRVLVGDQNVNAKRFTQPVFVPLGSTVNMMTQAQIGAATIRSRVLFWAGARGVLPPGLS